MAVTALGSGTLATEIGTEHFVANVNVAGTFSFHIDLASLEDFDSLELRAYQKVLSGGEPRVCYMARFDSRQPDDDLIKISVPVSNELAEAEALRFSIKQVSGTSRQYPWKVLRYS